MRWALVLVLAALVLAACAGAASGAGGSGKKRPARAARSTPTPTPAKPARPPQPIVTLEKGAVRGATRSSNSGRTFFSFTGIPYARPPVGKYRFKEPKASKPWQGVWDATRPAPKCLQYDRYPASSIVGDEDCLYLNVYTPRLPAAGSPLLDVIVWIHGGGFMFGGSADWGAEAILDHDVVLVSMNYRLGPLGFLSTEDDVVPGNNGLKDQAAALRWVQGNIAAFGGNPNSVTLLGCSAGGASVHYHYLSPLSQGLFHRGWSMSGSALNPWTQQEAALEKTRRLAELLGCPLAGPAGNATETRDLVECLRYRPAHAVVSAVPDFMDATESPFSPWAPSVEPAAPMTPSSRSRSKATHTVLNGPFLNQPPLQVIQAGLAHDLPWITGVTTEEGLFNAGEFLGPAHAAKLEDVDKRWLEVAPLLLDYNYTAPDAAERDAVSKAIREHYFGQRSLSKATKEFVAMVGDRIFNTGVELAAREMAAINTQPVYLYEYGYRGLSSLSDYMTKGDKTDYGVSHADDLPFLFNWAPFPRGDTPEDKKISGHLLTMLTTFARTGVPSFAPGSPTWLPVDPSLEDLNILRVDKRAELSMTTIPEIGQTSFWDSLPLLENEPDAAEEEQEGARDEL